MCLQGNMNTDLEALHSVMPRIPSNTAHHSHAHVFVCVFMCMQHDECVMFGFEMAAFAWISILTSC
jgi:hypothetical protein